MPLCDDKSDKSSAEKTLVLLRILNKIVEEAVVKDWSTGSSSRRGPSYAFIE